MKKWITIMCTFVMMFNVCTVHALEVEMPKTLRQETLDYMVELNCQAGYVLTTEEEFILGQQLDAVAKAYCLQFHVTTNQAYEIILEELLESMPLSYQCPIESSWFDEDNSCILRVSGVSSDIRAKVARWTKTQISAGTPYDYDFLNNKGDYYSVNTGTLLEPVYKVYPESGSYNCSELVWKAYKKVADVDLDGNGGLGVYPNDIYNSDLTYIVNSSPWN